MKVARAALVVLLSAGPAYGQATAAAPQDPRAQAMWEFMMARRLESSGDGPGALAALERARALDPQAAEIPAEIAGYYYRQNRPTAAVTAANDALELDKENLEAHHTLGNIYAAWAEGQGPPPAGETTTTTRAKAIEHLSAIQSTPLMATNPNLQMTLGRLQLRAGKADAAIPILEKVTQQAPWSPQPLLLLHEAQVSAGRFADAEASLVQAAEIDPRYSASLGQFYERQGKWDEAAAAYEAAVNGAKQPSRDVQIRYAAALINTESGAGRARTVLNELLKGSPNDARLLYLLSTAERTAGDDQAAEATARKLMALDPGSMGGLRALASVFYDRFDYRGLVDLVSPLAKDPTRARGREFEGAAALVQLGIAEQQLANWDGSIAAFAAAKSLTPRDPEIDAYLVQANLTARRFDRAELLAREALARDPNQPRMVRLRGQALLKGGRTAEANRLLEDSAAQNPRNREFVVGLADLYAEQKRTDDALRVLEQARATFGDDLSIVMRMVSVYEEGGRLAEAEQQLRRLMAEDPLNADAINHLGYLLADNNQRLPEAVELAERALKIQPGNPSFLDTLGWALFKQGRTQEAVTPLSKAAAMLAGNSVIQDHHGDVLARMGRKAEAIAAWQRALAGDGEHIDRAGIEKKIKAAR
ncbi:MAG: tetratricopeptide repeat protein [Acidimicrobiia bacterium]|nr:tetratricopeptide repeat protein [Acidimicrobiia bacterium]